MLLLGNVSVVEDQLAIGVPLLVVHVLTLHALEVEKQVLLTGLSAKVQLHPRVEAVLQTCLLFQLVEVEFPVEVWNGTLFDLAGSHAVLEHHSPRCLSVDVRLVALV